MENFKWEVFKNYNVGFGVRIQTRELTRGEPMNSAIFKVHDYFDTKEEAQKIADDLNKLTEV